MESKLWKLRKDEKIVEKLQPSQMCVYHFNSSYLHNTASFFFWLQIKEINILQLEIWIFQNCDNKPNFLN